MHAIRYTLQTITPILITSTAGEANTVNTERHIPGTSMLGSFAQRYIAHNNLIKPHEDPVFRQWFLLGGLRFTNACISSDSSDERFLYFPAPLSLAMDKYGPKLRPTYDRLFVGKDVMRKKRAKAVKSGFFRSVNQGFESRNVATRLNFHHARNAETGTPEDEKFFNFESIEAGARFTGYIFGKRKNVEDFLVFQQKHPEQHLYIGRSKTAQYGKVRMNKPVVIPEMLSEIPGWNTDKLEIDDDDCIALTLLSDMILYNKYGFSSTRLDNLQDRLPGRLLPEKSFIKTGRVENFNSIWSLPRPTEVCFCAGSCFLLKASDDDEKTLIDLQRQGLGERLQEGFGRFVLGWQTSEKAFCRTIGYERPKLDRPQGECPHLTKEVLKDIIRERLTSWKKADALQQAHDFASSRRHPSKSLVGRIEAIVRRFKPSQQFPDLQSYLHAVLNDPPKSNPHALRKVARDQLQRCRTKKLTLFDLLSDPLEDFNSMLKSQDDISAVMAATELSSSDFASLPETLHRTYLLTFFAALRKEIAKRKGGR